MKTLLHFTRKAASVRANGDVIDYTVPLQSPEWVMPGDEVSFNLGGAFVDDEGKAIEAIRIVGIKIDRVRYKR